MSLIDLASMVLAPTAVKDGKVYNAIPNDQDFTFSRGTEATRVNSAGLIEKARTNFLLQSNTFDTSWSTTSASVTGGQSGYDGTNNAWLFSRSSSIGYLFQFQSLSASINTISIYVKQGTSSTVRLDFVTGAFGRGASCTFDLSNGTAGSVTHYGSSSGFLAAITDVSNGWYRISLTGVTTADNWYHELALTSGNILIQSAQLEQGLVSTDYIPTTTSSVTVGITDDLPRVDYSGGGCPSLLLEGSRTNSVAHSEYFGSWTLLSSGSLNQNAATSPESVENATEIIWGASGSRVQYNFTHSATSATYSVFVKSNGGSSLNILLRNVTTSTNIAEEIFTGATFQPTLNTDSPISVSYGNGWYRVSITATSGITSGDTLRTYIYADNGGALLIYGAMVEEGNYVSSYLPTYGTSTSRSADSCSLTGASNLIGQSEGTLFVEFEIDRTPSETARVCILNNGTSSERVGISLGNSGLIYAFVVDGGSTTAEIISRDNTSGTYKVAFAYANNDFVFYNNSTQVGTDTSGTVSSCNQMDLGNQLNASYLGGGVKQAILFPTRLTNDQLAELTK